MLGLDGIEIDDPEQLGDAYDRAFRAQRPVVIEVHTDAEVPPLPPDVKYEQAVHVLKSILKGDPERWQMIKQAAKQMWAQIAP
jgi:pyruvate dehydrogenase (quinone)